MSRMGALALEILEAESREAEAAGVSDSDKARVYFRDGHGRGHENHHSNSHLPTALMPVDMVPLRLTDPLRTVKYFQPTMRDTVNGELIHDAATVWHDRVCTAVLPYGFNQYGVVIQNATAKVWEKPVVEVTSLVFFPDNKSICYFADGIWQQVMLHPMFTPLREDEMPKKIAGYIKDMRWVSLIKPEAEKQEAMLECYRQPKAPSTVVEAQAAAIEKAGDFPPEAFELSEVEKATSVAGSEPVKTEMWGCTNCLAINAVPAESDGFICTRCENYQVVKDAIPFDNIPF